MWLRSDHQSQPLQQKKPTPPSHRTPAPAPAFTARRDRPADARIEKVLELHYWDQARLNGIALSPDETMLYVANSDVNQKV